MNVRDADQTLSLSSISYDTRLRSPLRREHFVMKSLRPFALLFQGNRKWIFFSILTIIVVGSVVYYPASSIGFWADDYWLIETAGRLSLPDYLASWFDPRLQWRFYRPLQGLQWWIEYILFRSEPAGYHLVQILLHLTNTLLLFALTSRVSRRWPLGLVAAIVYLTLPVDSLAVFFPAAVDPLLALFYLLTLWLWIDYLECGGRWRFLLTFTAFVFALMSKEVAATLPLTLFLADRWLIAKPTASPVLVKRYGLFFLSLIPYGLLELHALTLGLFTTQLGYGFGGHIFSALTHHLAVLAFPWSTDSPANLVWPFVVLGICSYIAAKREFRLLFLVTAVVLALLPVLPFPLAIAQLPRYLYLSLMGAAAIVAVLIEGMLHIMTKFQRRWMSLGLALALVGLIIWSSAVIADAATSFAGTVRETRLQFRPVFQKHAAFAPDTLLYFINPPDPNISGVMFSRYGKNVIVDGTDTDHIALLRDHTAAYVFYLDDDKLWHEQSVAKKSAVLSAPDPPVQFGDKISLDRLELVDDRVKRGDEIILLAYWRAIKKVDQDYTVFAHLVDRDNQIVAGTDGQPRGGSWPTTRWRLNEQVPDGIVIPIPKDAPVGNNYRLEVGLYYLPTLERLLILNAQGQPITDKVLIGPISIVE